MFIGVEQAAHNTINKTQVKHENKDQVSDLRQLTTIYHS